MNESLPAAANLDPSTALPLQNAPFPETGIDFRSVFDAIPSPSLLLTPQFMIAGANDAYLRIAGRTREEILGRNVFEVFPDNPSDPHADGVANLRASLQRVIATCRVDTMPVQRYDVATQDGGDVYSSRYWKVVNAPVADATGKVGYIIHTVEEVRAAQLSEGRGLREVLATLTDRIRDLRTPEQIGYEAAAILGEAFATSRVGYGTIDHESDTLIVVRDWCAAGVETLAGESALRAYGSFIDDLKLGKFIAIANVDDDPRTASAAAALRGRSAAAFVNVPVVEEGVLAAVLFVNDANPREWTDEELLLVKEVAARIRTASERLRVLSALRESEARFRTITDAMPQIVWSTLPDGYHDYFNAQWYSYTGVPPGSTDGEGWNAVFHPDDQQRAWDVWSDCLKTGRTYEIQYRLRHHSGNYRWVLGRALPIRDDEGNIIRWMGTSTDIHDQKQAEEELRKASGRKDEFLAMLAHELRNPLAPISSAAQLLTMWRADPDLVRKSGEIILRQVRHLTNLVDDLLDVSRVTRGLVQVNRVELDLKEILHSAVEQARPLVESREHELAIELAPAPTWVAGDKTRLVQVVVNLLNNAAKYTAKGGRIALSLQVHGREACIAVTDNGSGIAADLLPNIFDLFIQAERTPDRTQGGLGLGLALVNRIVALHDGSVHALSGGLGMGSTFMMFLPLLEVRAGRDPSSAADIPPASTPGTAGAEGQAPLARVMIVDDHLDGMQTLATLLEVQGFAVMMAEDGTGCLQAAEGQQIDAFILDIGLPDIDGLELARRLRANDREHRALLIALTGYGNKEDRLLSKDAGFDYHLVKPVDVAALTRIIACHASADPTAGIYAAPMA